MKELRFGLACLFLVVLIGGCSDAPDSDVPPPTADIATAVTTPPLDVVSVMVTVSPLPTATPIPTVEPLSVSTPTATASPPPQPEGLNIVPQCKSEGDPITCFDDLLHISFAYPARWGELRAYLRKGWSAGFLYGYFFSAQFTLQEQPDAGGLSSSFAEPRGGGLSDFWGFTTSSQQMCDEQPHAVLCRVIKPGVIVSLYFPIAEQLCAPPAPYGFTGSSTGAVFVNLPEPNLINGFVFYARFIDEEQLKALDGYKDCTAEGQQRFDASVQTLIQQVQAGSAPPEMMERVNTMYQLAESLEGIGIGEYRAEQ